MGGWETSSILQARSGLPENVTLESGFFAYPFRPDYVSGQSQMLSRIHWPDQSLNPAAFAVMPGYDEYIDSSIGTLGRNSARGPAFFQWDFSLMKNIPVTERVKFQFRGDFFNLLNHPNFSNPDGGVCQSISLPTGTSPAICIPSATFGRVGTTINNLVGTGASRQVQLSMKLLF